METLHDRVPKDAKLHEKWGNFGGYCTKETPKLALTLEFSDASEEYAEYMWEVNKWWPPACGWSNWYSDKQAMVFRRWSTFDLALSSWVSGLIEPLKKQLEASRFCEHTVIDPTPHHRFLRLPFSRDILRPNLGLNAEGLGDYILRVAQDLPVKLPVMIFQVACPQTLEATRNDIWRYLCLSGHCRVGVIFIVNSFYDQHLKPFKLSMEIWSKQTTDLEYPYAVDDCALPSAQSPPIYPSGEDNRHAEWGPMNEEHGSIGSFASVDSKPVLKRNADGLLTFKPTEDEESIIMRHREEIVVIDETKEEVDLLKNITFLATDFIPLCKAKLDQDITIKSVKLSLDSLRECVRQEWYYCHTMAPTRPRPGYRDQFSYHDRLSQAYEPGRRPGYFNHEWCSS